jgi:hypothetical protein
VTHQALQAAVEAAAGGVVVPSTLFDISEPKAPVPVSPPTSEAWRFGSSCATILER